jgi:hypothetical protein
MKEIVLSGMRWLGRCLRLRTLMIHAVNSNLG